MIRKSKTIRATAVAFAHFMRALHDGRCSVRELMEETGLSEVSIRGYLRSLRRQKLVARVGYERDAAGRQTIELFSWAPDREDFYRTKDSDAKKSARYRERQKAKRLATAVSGHIERNGHATIPQQI